MNAYLEIIRPGNAVMAAIAVILMMFVGHYYELPIIICALIVFVCTGAGNTINDVFDVKIDEINKPNRPIPSGRISLENARNYAFALFGIGIALSFVDSYLVNSIWPSVIVIPAAVIMYLYARNLKAMPLIGNLTVATLTGFCFVIAGTVIACATNSLKILLLFNPSTSFLISFVFKSPKIFSNSPIFYSSFSSSSLLISSIAKFISRALLGLAFVTLTLSLLLPYTTSNESPFSGSLSS